ncbi:MAG: hypothetical protein U1E22_02150 [Coriobacteriia bacterium]|nr:hypothetical protein [Coriobacteriia bacterium]
MSNEIEHRIDVDVPLPVELQLEDGSTADFWTQVKQEPGSVISEGDERRLIELQFASDGDGMTATALVKWADWPASTKEQESLDPLPWMRQVPGDERTYEVTGSVLQARPDNPRALQVLVFSEDDGVSVTHVFHVLLWDTSKVSSVDGTPMSEAEFTQTLRAVPAETTWTVVFSVEAPGLLVQSIAPTHKAD